MYIILVLIDTTCVHAVIVNFIFLREDLTQTCGSTHGLHLLCTFLFSEGDLIFVECFSYFLALEMFRTGLGMSLVSGIYSIHDSNTMLL